MKPGEAEEPRISLKNLSSEELEKLLSTLLRELRRRDSDQIKGDFMAVSKALGRIRDPC